MFVDIVWVLYWLICFEFNITSPEDGNKYFPLHCVSVCFVTTEEVINIWTQPT
jgi:hypothetical protein